MERLKKRKQFLNAAKGWKGATPGIVLQTTPRPNQPPRLGFTASRKVGNAVKRNRAKRRLRELSRSLAHLTPHGLDLVLIARKTTPSRPFNLLLNDLKQLLQRASRNAQS